MDDSIGWQIILQFILIALNAIFACAEIAVISTSDNKLEKLAQEGDKRAQMLLKLTDQPAKFLATIQVAITLSGFLASAFAADNFSDLLVDLMVKAGIPLPVQTLNTIAVIIITLILSFFTLVLGELVPKRIAMRKSEGIALAISRLVFFISKIFAPIVWLLTVSTNAVLRLIGIDPNSEDEEISEEEIRMMADAGSEKGIIDEDENKIIQNVFEFDDTTVGEIATHRTEVDFLYDEDSIEDWKAVINKSSHTYYPICGDTADNIIGILDSRIFYRLEDLSRENIIKKAVKKAVIVPENIGADVLLRRMKETREHFAVVCDEFGGTFGIITLTDLIEKLIGDLSEESENDIEEKNGIFIVSGSCEVDKFEEYFDLKLNGESTTISGWITEQLNKIPQKGDILEYENLKLTVTKTDDRKILEITAEKLKQPETEKIEM